MIVRTQVVALLASFAISGCSGGGSSIGTGGAPAGGSPAGGLPGPGSSVPTASTRAQFTITVPSRSATSSSRERRAYVSASTQSVVITLLTVNGSTYTGSPQDIASNLTSGNPNCTGNPLTCTVSAPAAAGTDVFLVATYDQSQASASPTSPAGHLLSQATLSIAVVANQANMASTPLILSGAPASFVISGLPPATVGTAFVSPQSFIVNAKDAGGNTIVGTYLHPVTLTDSDTSGATTLATSGGDSPPNGTLLSSADTATLNYNGASLSSATITAAATGATSAISTFAPTVPTVAITGLSTTTGLIGTTTTATVTGSGFTNSAVVGFSGSGVTVQTTYVNATTLTATIFVDPEAATGARNVTVTAGPAMATLSNGFTISNGGVTVVTLATDTVPGSPPGSGTGASGDLRYAILNAPAGNTIVFDTTAMGGSTITLAGPLPPIEHNVTIDGGYYGRVTIDGANAHRAFFVDTGTVSLRNLVVQNALAKGGNGGDNPALIYANDGGASPGGGGFGAGACLFVNQSSAAVTLTNDYLSHCIAAGGNGGNATAQQTNSFGGGGGGLGGNAAPEVGAGYLGGGGGGVLGAGSVSTNSSGGAGGVGGGGGGIGGCGLSQGSGGAAYGSNTAGTSASSSGPGNGGFGGGGGGGGSLCTNTRNGSTGGFGGGGGGSWEGGASGSGGVGGGGSGSSSGPIGAPSPGSGGSVVGPVTGGAGGSAGASTGGGPFATYGSSGGGGGGAAAGPAVFVNAGSVTTANSGAANASATGGSGGSGGASYSGSNAGSNGSAGTADTTPVFNYAGTVNGSTTTGPISGAIGSSTPSLRRGHAASVAPVATPRRSSEP
jgi:hypothetical protein